MRINLIWLHLVVAVMTCLHADAQTNGLASSVTQENTFSLSQDDIKDETGEEEGYYIRCMLHHILMPETLPAALDTNGNWGTAKNGLRLSLRFHKKQYACGEIIPAIAILRNLEDRSRTLLLTNSHSYFLALTVRYENHMMLAQRKEPAERPNRDGSSMPSPPRGLLEWRWDARSEKAVVLDLNRFFALTNAGNYTVTATCRVYSEATNSVSFEVVSGSVSFNLVNGAEAR